MNLSTIAALRAVTSVTPTQFRAGSLAHDLPGRRRSMPAIRSALPSEKAAFAQPSKFLRHGPYPKRPSVLAAPITSCIAPARDLRSARGHRTHPSMAAFATQADPVASLATSRGHHGKRGIAILREKILWQNLCRASQTRCTRHSQSHFMCSRSSLLFSPQS